MRRSAGTSDRRRRLDYGGPRRGVPEAASTAISWEVLPKVGQTRLGKIGPKSEGEVERNSAGIGLAGLGVGRKSMTMCASRMSE